MVKYLFSTSKDAVLPPRRQETTAAPTETQEEAGPTPVVASRDSDIRQAIQGFVLEGTERGQILLRDYQGDPQEDMKNMFSFMLTNAPKYNYAMDSFDCSVSHVQNESFVNVNMKLHLSPQELRAIESRSFQSALKRIYRALGEQVNALTIQISSFPEDADLYALLAEFFPKTALQISKHKKVNEYGKY